MERDLQITQHNEQLATRDRQIEALREALVASRRNNVLREQQIQELLASQAGLRTANLEAETGFGILQTEFEDYRTMAGQEERRREDELQREQVHVDRAREENEALTTQLQNLREEHTTQLQNAREEIGRRAGRLDGVQAQLDEARAHNRLLIQNTTRLQNELDVRNRAYNDFVTHNEAN